jgi:hypothetical protein
MNKKVMVVIFMTLMSNMLAMGKIINVACTLVKLLGEATLLPDREEME